MVNIIISFCTYQRPHGLDDLFASLSKIEIPPNVDVSVRVVDNDSVPSAKDKVTELASLLPWQVDYVHEPNPGIPQARNRALAEALDQDYLIFIDDDETVSADWLLELWKVQRPTKANFVQGPLIFTVDNAEDDWWINSGFFTQRTFANEAPRHEAWTNNVMIDIKFIREHSIRFDQDLGFDGGEDTLFFQDMIRAGATGAYAANAIAYEVQPVNRLTWSWAIKRQFRYGTTRARCATMRNSKYKSIAHCLFRSAACSGVGLIILPLAIIKGRIGLANSCVYFARSAGIIWGLLGKRYLEYNRANINNNS